MDPILIETNHLLLDLFNNEEKLIIDEIKEELIRNPETYNIENLWVLDRKIGGIGAYSMPANPVRNPIPGGIGRTIYRPLQYARANIENRIYDNSRYAIQNVGLHLEGLTKYIIKKDRFKKNKSSNRRTLGQAKDELNKEKYSERVFISLEFIIKIYNRSKHEIENDENRLRTFTPIDAIIFYLACRKIGNELLVNHKKDLYKEISEYIDRLDISESLSNCTL